MSEQDRKNANEYHYENYKNILIALNSNDETDKIIELADVENHN